MSTSQDYSFVELGGQTIELLIEGQPVRAWFDALRAGAAAAFR